MKNIEIKNNMLRVEIYVPLDGRNIIKMMDKVASEIIEKAVILSDNNKQKASDLIGVNRTTVLERLRHINPKLIRKPNCGGHHW